MRKILKLQEVTILDDRNGDEAITVMREVLVEFNPPVCSVCEAEMKNVNTVEGKRRYQCMTWGCTNHRLYNQDGEQLGQNSGYAA